MLRNVLAALMALLTGAFGLLLLASIVVSCRQNPDPHQKEPSELVHAPVTSPSSQETHEAVPVSLLLKAEAPTPQPGSKRPQFPT